MLNPWVYAIIVVAFVAFSAWAGKQIGKARYEENNTRKAWVLTIMAWSVAVAYILIVVAYSRAN